MLVTIAVQGIMDNGPGYQARLESLSKALATTAQYHMVGVLVYQEDEIDPDPTEESNQDAL